MKKKSKIVLKILDNIEMLVAGVVLVALVLCTFFGVFARYIFNKPFNWLEEMQLASMVWITYLVAGVAFRTNSHVAIEIVVDALPKKAQKVVEVLISAVVYFVLTYLFFSAMKFLQVFVKTGRSTPMLRIPYLYIYGIGPVSCVLMAISYTISLVKRFKKPSDSAEKEA